MKNQSIQVGDRARVYGAISGVAQPVDGQVKQVCASGMLRVQSEPFGGEVLAHPKQCRRLKKRKPRAIGIAVSVNGVPFISSYLESDFKDIPGKQLFMVERKTK
jgi:hypothetical protein